MLWQYVALIATALGPGEGPSQEPAAAPPTGHLVVVGGGPINDAIRRRVLELAGGPKARVVVVSQATREPLVWGARHAQEWTKVGAAQATVLDVADARKAVALVESADLIWISGGSQKRLVQALAGTGVPEAIYRRYAQGATVAGTSAGAAAMSRVMIAGYQAPAASGERSVEIADGLGLWPEVIVDQHFVKRKRQKRLRGVIVSHPDLIGVGIDESTAVVVTGHEFEVIGLSQVIVMDARKAAHGPKAAPTEGKAAAKASEATATTTTSPAEPAKTASPMPMPDLPDLATYTLTPGMRFSLDRGVVTEPATTATSTP